ncbi:MAG: hypothetical protein ACE5GW_05785, partial [Planctomycetota bacterium]
IDVEVRAGAELLLVDAGGAPLLLSRRHGKGRSLLWASGLDPDSLPPGRAGERLRAALATLLVSAARAAAAPGRRVERSIDSEGRAWLTLERLEGERALLPVVLRLPGEASRPPVEAVAVDPQRSRVAIPASPSAPWRLRIAGDREADQELGGIPGPPRDDAALSRLLRRSKGHAPATAEHPLELLFLLVAALVALRSWGAASPAAPASPRLGSSAAMEG